MKQIKVFLDDSEIPRQWYNILPDMPSLSGEALVQSHAGRFVCASAVLAANMQIVTQVVATDRIRI